MAGHQYDKCGTCGGVKQKRAAMCRSCRNGYRPTRRGPLWKGVCVCGAPTNKSRSGLCLACYRRGVERYAGRACACGKGKKPTPWHCKCGAWKVSTEARCELCETNYVPCSGCGLRNYETRDAWWTCPDFPRCAERVAA